MELKNLLEPVVVKRVCGPVDMEITGIVYDSRKASPGSVFICLPGSRCNGCDFIPDAIQRGAVAVVTDREVKADGVTLIQVPRVRPTLALMASVLYSFPSQRLKVIGVTGTNGKTTTTHLIDALMKKRYQATGLLGTISYKIGDETVPVVATTPEASDLQYYLARMVEKGVECVTMEVSSHALDQHRVAGCDFNIAVLTNITEDHLDYHLTPESYRLAKGKFFSQLGNTFFKNGEKRVAVINRDDPSFEFISSQTANQQVTYGINTGADIVAERIKTGSGSISYRIHSFAGDEVFNLKLTGLFNVYNSLAAIAVGLVEGLPLPLIKETLEKVSGPPGRFEMIESGRGFTVIIDYAHTPDGLENVLRAIREFSRQRVITIFGCGGDRDRHKRPLMGEIAARYSDYCILTNDNPRSEDPMQIAGDVIPGIEKHMQKGRYEVILDRYQAIERGLCLAEAGDVVLIAGKGHEDYQVFKDRTIKFSDRRAVEEIINRSL